MLIPHCKMSSDLVIRKNRLTGKIFKVSKKVQSSLALCRHQCSEGCCVKLAKKTFTNSILKNFFDLETHFYYFDSNVGLFHNFCLILTFPDFLASFLLVSAQFSQFLSLSISKTLVLMTEPFR